MIPSAGLICPECGYEVRHRNLQRHRIRAHWCSRCNAFHRPGEAHYQRPVIPADGEATIGYLTRNGFEPIRPARTGAAHD